ncbi:MAG: HAMP domain-containing sensor histidine kinase [Candidatus Paceibacterota bacterium]|jgi:signal transduction histidine kinase
MSSKKLPRNIHNTQSPWDRPLILFPILGTLIAISEATAYYLGGHYLKEPVVVLIVMALATILLVISFVIAKGFEKLAEINRMKSEFIEIVSRELGTPLADMSRTLDLILSGRAGKIPYEMDEYFASLKKNNTQVRDLVSNLLVVSRLQSGTLVFNNDAFSLEGMTNSMITLFKPYSDSREIEIVLNCEKGLKFVHADQKQIRIAAENLLDNAIRYSPKKSKVIVTLAYEEKGMKVRFEVKDSGAGIPKDDQKHLFKKFFRSENAMKRQSQGSGLGLYVAKTIIEMSDGEIGFESEENIGTTFWFTLPTTL